MLNDVYELTRAQGFGDEVKRRVLIGTYVLSAGYYDAYYLKALKVRRRIADDFTAAFGKVDALLTPTAPSAAFGLGDKVDDPIAMYLNDIFTVPVNLAGLPALSLPGALDKQGLPLGLQLIGRALDEGTLFTLAGALEKAAAFTSKAKASLLEGGSVLACHWRRGSDDCEFDGDEVHRRLDAGLEMPRVCQALEDDFRIDVWCDDPRSVAQQEGFA